MKCAHCGKPVALPWSVILNGRRLHVVTCFDVELRALRDRINVAIAGVDTMAPHAAYTAGRIHGDRLDRPKPRPKRKAKATP